MKHSIILILLLGVASLNAMMHEPYPLEKELQRRHIEHPIISAFFEAVAAQDFEQAERLLRDIRGLFREIKTLRSADFTRLSDFLSLMKARVDKSCEKVGTSVTTVLHEPDLSAVQNRLGQCHDELVSIKAELAQKDAQLADLQRRLKRAGVIPGEMEALREENNQLREHRGSLIQQVNDLHERVAHHEAALQESAQLKDAAQQEMVQLKERLSGHTQALERSDRSLEEFRDALKAAKEQAETAQNYSKAIEETHKSGTQTTEKRIADLQDTVKQQAMQLNQYEEHPEQLPNFAQAAANMYKHVFDPENGALRRIGRIALGNDRPDSSQSESRRALRTIYYSMGTIIDAPTNQNVMNDIGAKVNTWFNKDEAAVTDPYVIDPTISEGVKNRWALDLGLINQRISNVKRQIEESKKKAPEAKQASVSRGVKKKVCRA